MIVVLGRPGLGILGADEATGPEDGRGSVEPPALHGRAAQISVAARKAGASVELVGSVGDDPEGDLLMVALGRAGIGHAAVLRDPTAGTPTWSAPQAAGAEVAREGEPDSGAAAARRLPRLDPGDVSLGLSYISECSVLVIAEPLSAESNAVAADAAAYHGAAIVAVTEEGVGLEPGLPEEATVLAAAPGDQDAFAELVARYAAALDRGESPADAFRSARDAAGWETVGR
jgi:sugar/nucleoside kinase (ribokinase family)